MVLSHLHLKNILMMFFFLTGLSALFAASPSLDISFSEEVYEYVTYNPLVAGGGTYTNANENRTVFTMNGTIFIENIHTTEALQDIVLNISGISDIYNVTFLSGAQSYIAEFNTVSDYMILTIPDLAQGANTTLRYDVNTTLVTPPLNFTTNYSDSKVFVGLPVTITDTISNELNVSRPNTCLYNINITQFALELNDSLAIYNTSFDSVTGASGTDSGNVAISADNRTLSWDVQGGACLDATNTTDITYDVVTPSAVAVAQDYQIVNTTISYDYNETFSSLSLDTIEAVVDLDLTFEKYINNTLTGDNATWRISSNLTNPTNIDVNVTQVSHWVSVRDATGTGFTNPSVLDNDTISGSVLEKFYPANILLNSTTGAWNNSADIWYFNYTYSASPIVWMDVDSNVVNDGVQLLNRSISYGTDIIYVKELYLATGYWLEVNKNITRINDNSYTVVITVINRGTSPTPADQVVQIYNFLPNTFSLNGSFDFSSSTWYTSAETNETLLDPIYNGTMFQFGILPNGNSFNSSLAPYGSGPNANNSWVLTFNVTGSGEFQFDDLFLTGADPLQVEEYGSTTAISVEGAYDFAASKFEYVLGIAAVVVGLLVLFM